MPPLRSSQLDEHPTHPAMAPPIRQARLVHVHPQPHYNSLAPRGDLPAVVKMCTRLCMMLARKGRRVGSEGLVLELSRRALTAAADQLRERALVNSKQLASSLGEVDSQQQPAWGAGQWQRGQQVLQARNYSSSSSSDSSGSGSSSNAVLANTTSFLRNLDNGAEVFLVGTAHVSRRSAEEVRDMIRLVRPDTVLVELCEGRAQRLRQGQPASEMDFFKDMLSLLAPGASNSAGGAASGFGSALFKLSMQGMYRFLKSLGMDPGGEFKVAIEEAERIGARVVYGDRDVQLTLQRLASSLDLRDVLRMMTGGGLQPPPQALIDFFNSQSGSSFESQVEALKTRQMAREMSMYMRQVNPQLAAALIDERDQIMVDNLRKLRGRVVGVVGLAHLDGIERRWEELQHGSSSAVVRGY